MTIGQFNAKHWRATTRLQSEPRSCANCGRLNDLSDYGDDRGTLCVGCVSPRLVPARGGGR